MKNQDNTSLRRNVSLTSGLAVAAGGLVVLIGWYIDSYQIQTFWMNGVTMKANTALSFFLYGIALILSINDNNKISIIFARALAAVILVISFFTLIEYAFTTEFVLDKAILLKATNTVNALSPERMAPNTAINFLLFSIVFVSSTFFRLEKSLFVFALFVIAVTISFAALAGYILNLEDLTGIGDYPKMAFNTSLGFIILSVGLFTTMYNRKRINFSIEYKLLSGLTVISVAMILGSIISIASIKSLVASSDWVKHTLEVKEQLRIVDSEINGMVASDRGFLLSGNKEFSDQWKKSNDKALSALNKISELTDDNPEQQETLYILTDLILDRMDFSNQLISRYNSGGQRSALELFATLTGNTLHKEIEKLISKMDNEESRLLKERNITEIQNADSTLYIILATLVIQMFLLALIFVLVKSDVTGRRKAEENLEELNKQLENLVQERTEEILKTEKKYRSIIETTLIGVYNTTVEGKILYANDALLNIIEVDSFEEFSKSSITEYYKNSEDRKRLLEILNKKDAVTDFEVELITKNGNSKYVLLSAKLEDNIITGMMLDITERKKVEEESKRYTRKLANQVPGALYEFRIDPNGNMSFPFITDGIEVVHPGLTPEMLMNNASLGFSTIHSEDVERVNESIQYSYKSLNNWNEEFRIVLDDGSIKWHSANAKPEKMENGTVSWYGMFQDITERKKVEEKIRRANRVYAVLSNINQMIVRAKEKQFLFEESCRIAIEHGKFSMAWIGLIDNTKNSLNSIASAGIHKEYLSTLKIDLNNEMFANSPIGSAIKTGAHSLANDITNDPGMEFWHKNAQRLDYRSVAAFPIVESGNTIGAIMLYSNDPFFFDSAEMELLDEMSNDISYALDVIENEAARKETDNRLMAERERFSRLVSSLNDVVWTTDISGDKIEDVNHSFEKIYGASLDSYRANPNLWLEMVHPEDKHIAIKSAKQLKLAGSAEAEYRIVRSDGSIVWILDRKSKIYDADGNPTQIGGIAKDITERKLAEDLIKESEEKYRKLVNEVSDGFFITDKQGILTFANNALAKILGFSKWEEVSGRNFLEFLPEETAALYNELYNDSIKGKANTNHLEVEITKPNKVKAIIEVKPVPIIENNEVVGSRGTIRDITERKLAEEKIRNINEELEMKVEKRTEQLAEKNEELTSAKSEAERANHAKSDFLSRMSHELRTPMNSILGFAQLMDMGELAPNHKKGVSQIMKSGKHLLGLINEVLDLSKIEAGKLTLSIEPVEICNVISETVDILNPLAEAKSIKMDYAKVVGNLFIKADHQKLKQVLLNLLSNAVKYNSEGGSVRVECGEQVAVGSAQSSVGSAQSAVGSLQSAVDSQQSIRISVIDTGNGIAASEIDKLFVPFQRVGSNQSEIEGTGLGLAVAKQLVEAMNGRIGVESEIGVGSTFWIELPKCESQMTNHENKGSFRNPDVDKAKIEGTLLYIEDNASNVQLVEQIISTHRPAISQINETYGKNAVKLAKEYKPNLILLDLDLPDTHGSEVFTLLQKDIKTKSIPVVILSADAIPKQIDSLMQAGAKKYLTKPLDVIEFLEVVDEWMNKNKS